MLDQFFNRLAEWRRLRRDVHRMQHLDDRLLADLGVSRTDIAAAVRTGSKRPRTLATPLVSPTNPQPFRLRAGYDAA